ncbi:LysR family transcriptional regulator [Streptomyces malaysiense]|uniref:LysR family transcriptional regulator n=1 Tax=Streptomyces malaysiense TaxID=1428626 RepID=A0A1J4Q8D7_9ACTN|nr:LysR family transcriptional regulator [Streptomyces malaysiense]
MLEVRRLRVLAEFAARGTVTATAEALHLTGPAVSQQLAALEREAGLPLLEKRGRTLRLTEAGRRLVEHAAVVLGTLAAAESDIAALRRGERALVRIAAFPSVARALLPGLWPDPDGPAGSDGPDDPGAPLIELVEHEPDPAEAALARREVDLAITHSYSLLPRPLPAGCERRDLFREPVFLVLHRAEAEERALAAGTPADLTAFADAPWLLPGPDTACHEMAGRACGAAGFVPRAVAVASDFAVLCALAARRAGVALVPRLALPAPVPPGLSVHPLREPVHRGVHAVYRAGTGGHPGTRRVLDRLAEPAPPQG